MNDIEELIKYEPYKSCYEYGIIIGREEAIDEWVDAIKNLEEDKIFLEK